MSDASHPGRRHEFRAFFAPGAGPPVDLTGLARLDMEERTDRYLLVRSRPDCLPKLRAGQRFEIKRHLGTTPPLELWELAVSSAFPLDDAACEASAALFGVDRSALASAAENANMFCDAIAGRARDVTMIDVAKQRQRFGANGLVAERTIVALPFVGGDMVTIGFECADPAKLIAAVDAAGLSGEPNTNYGAFLRTACGL